jgi:hypothetical protein
MVGAARTSDRAELRQIFGPKSKGLLTSGDKQADRYAVDKFLQRYDEKHRLEPSSDGAMTLAVGNDDWPFPIPLVQNNQKDWFFDTGAGKDEMVRRRIGTNELDAIQTCLAIVDAQREYAMMDPAKTGLPVYAQKFLSEPGKKNGLYWKTSNGEVASPLGPLAAEAEQQGYSLIPHHLRKPRPFHGYCYRILTAQGPHAKGGARNYMDNGQLLSGFGLVAYPVEYGKSGIMTFITNQDGVVYQSDLGPRTERTARSMRAFDPGPEWKQCE